MHHAVVCKTKIPSVFLRQRVHLRFKKSDLQSPYLDLCVGVLWSGIQNTFSGRNTPIPR